MSVITNEPVFLNSTGEALLNRLDTQNAYLAVLAQSSRSSIYSNITQIANIVAGGTVESNSKIFPVGDQLLIPWKDMDDTNHNTDETAWPVLGNIVKHKNAKLITGETILIMLVQWHLCSPYGVQFSHQQAFKKCTDGLAAGTYYVILGSSWGSKGAVANSAWNFTLTQDVPAVGRLSGFELLPDVLSSTWKVKSWATPLDTSPIEEVAVSSGAVGTCLGTMNYNTLSDDGLNSMQNVAFGNNRYKTSAIRQYLTSIGLNWFSSQTDFDIRPDQYAKHGFMSGFSDEFLAAVKPIEVQTALNTVEGYTNTYDTTYDKFFLPSLEEINCTPQLASVEGPYFDYWRRRLGLSGFASYHPTLYEGYKIPAINATTAPQYVRLRSASRGSSYGTWGVYSSGGVYDSSACSAFRFSPVCGIG